MITYDKLYIGGEWVEPSSGATIDVISPFSEELVAQVPEAREADVDRAVAAAREAFDHGPWPRTTPAERAAVLTAISQAITARSDEIARTISTEMGCPLMFSMLGQTFAATMVADYFAGLAESFAFESVRPGMLGPALVRHEPVGVAAGIIPWNVPLFISMLKIAPSLLAGGSMVLKPAPEAPVNSFILAEILMEAGVPAGVVNIVPAGREVGAHLVAHPDIDKVSFTGSTAAGRSIASVAGEQLKRVTLELGGKSAAIICDDADVAAVIPELLPAAIMNNGQACVAQTRILASRSKYDEVVDALVAAMADVKVGDPLDLETVCGPLVAERQRDRVEGYLALGQDEGAKIALGGGRPAAFDKGWFVEPTVFTNVDNSMRIAQEEIFGPVLAVIPFEDEADAVRIANDSDYGLSGSVWCGDVDRGLDIARGVRTGTYTVNGFMMEFSAPFGGFKSSGVGRELGPEGLSAYLESKTINLPFGYEVPGFS